MDLSIFNLLTGLNPNASAAENSFIDAAQDNVSDVASPAQQKTKAGEAFLKALEQARTGRPGKDADILYNMASARADAVSSLKDLKKGALSREDVKVVKLQIKRTRASETLRKADERKTAAALSSPQQSGQKIPTRENIAVPQEKTVIRPETDNTRETAQFSGFEEIILPEEAVAPQEIALSENEELTAADILITSALQTTFAPLSQARTETTVRPVEEIDTAPERIFIDEDRSPVLRPEKTADPQKAEAPVGAENEPETKRIAAPSEKTEIRQDEVSFLSQKTDDCPVSTKKDEENVVLTEKKPTEKTEKDVSVSRPAVKTDDKKAVRTLSAEPVKTVTAVATDDTREIADFQDFQTKSSNHEARRQAQQLASQLPAGNKIAISVETQTPVAGIAVPLHKESHRSAGVKVVKADTESDLPVLTEQDAPADVRPEEKSLQPSSRPEQNFRHAEEQLPDQPDGLTVVMPVQNKVLSESSSVTETTQNGVGETSAPPTAQPSAAPFSVGHELKGKAVSGSAPVQKNVPVNELVDQIKVNIRKALKEGLDKIDIVLKPKELGTIKIHLEIGKDGTMKAVLNTARAETLDLLQSDLTVLKQALADSGFDLNDQAFSFNYRGERYNDEQKQPQNGKHGFSAERTEDEDAEESAGNLSISGRYALNIRV